MPHTRRKCESTFIGTHESAHRTVQARRRHALIVADTWSHTTILAQQIRVAQTQHANQRKSRFSEATRCIPIVVDNTHGMTQEMTHRKRHSCNCSFNACKHITIRLPCAYISQCMISHVMKDTCRATVAYALRAVR